MIHDRLVCLHQARAAMQVLAATEEAGDEDLAPRDFMARILRVPGGSEIQKGS